MLSSLYLRTYRYFPVEQPPIHHYTPLYTTDTSATSSGSACCVSRIGCTAVAQQWPSSQRRRPSSPSAGSSRHSCRINSNSSSTFLSSTNFFGRPRFACCATPAPLFQDPRAKHVCIASSAGTPNIRSLHFSKNSRGLEAEGVSSSSNGSNSNNNISGGGTPSLAVAVLFLQLQLLLDHHHQRRLP